MTDRIIGPGAHSVLNQAQLLMRLRPSASC